MASQKPIIFIVTGAWHVPEHYQVLAHRLRHQGFTVECPLLLTNTNAKPPVFTLDDDVNQIRNLALQYLDSGRDIIAIVHSYGGVVGSNAFAGLGAIDRPKSGHVKALLYMSAFLPMENESLAGIFGGALPSFLTPNEPEQIIDITDPGFHFYNDLPPEQQQENVSRLVCHPIVAQYEPLKVPVSRVAWRCIPVTYLLCSEDQALPLQVQEMMVDRIEKSELGVIVNREYCTSSHSPFLSVPNQVVEVLRRVYLAGEHQQGRDTSLLPDTQTAVAEA